MQSLPGVTLTVMKVDVKTHRLFLFTEHGHGYRGHQEQALGLSVKQLWNTFITIIKQDYFDNKS